MASGREYRLSILVTGRDAGASSMLGGLGNSLSSFAGIAAGLVSGAIFYKIAQGISQISREALTATADWERMSLTMESLVARELRIADSTLTMTDALALAGEKSQELLGWVQSLAINSPFDMEGVMTTYRQALAFGFTSDEGQQLTQVLVDMSAGMGLTSDKMQLVSYALGQIRQSDRLLMQDLRQLMNAGVPVNDILQEMGYSLADVGVEAISTSEFLEVFNRKMGEDFEGAAKRQATSWAGLLNTFSDLKKMGLRNLFEGIFEALQPLAVELSTWLQDEGLEKLKEWGRELGTFTEKLINVGRALTDAGFGSVEFKEAFGDLLEQLGVDISELSPADFANFASDLWVNLTAAMKESADDVDWGEVSASVIEGINDIDWAVQGQNMAEGARNLIDAIKIAISDVVAETDWAGLWESGSFAVADFVAGLFGQDKEGADRIIQDTIGGWKLDIQRGIDDLKAFMITKGPELIGGFALGILSAVGLGGVAAAFMSIVEIADRTMKKIRDLMLAHGQGAMNKFAEGVNNAKATAITALSAAYDALKKIIAKGIHLAISVGLPNFAALAEQAAAGMAMLAAALSGGGGGQSGGAGGQWNKPKPKLPSGGGVAMMAEGGSFTVPPGYPNDSFFMGLTSGERVSVAPAGGGKASPMGGGSGLFVQLNFTYAPAVSMATQYEARDVLAPMLVETIRAELSKRGLA
jgi:tape measure domain-containing protein